MSENDENIIMNKFICGYYPFNKCLHNIMDGYLFPCADLGMGKEWMNTHKWWSTLKSAAFGLSSSLPPLVGGGGGLVCESLGKADRLSDNFYNKHSRESVDLPLTCHPSPIIIIKIGRQCSAQRE